MRPIPILLYHSVTDDPSPALGTYTLAPSRLRDHAAVIADQGWRVLTIAELAREMTEGNLGDEPTLALTFDDGFADTAEYAAPILAEHDFSATLYVTSGRVGAHCDWLGPEGRRPMASWAQLRDLSASGWEIGAHSISHVELDVVAMIAAREQIRGSRAALQQALGLPVESFAYPHGYHSRRVRQEVIAAGFRTACAVKNVFSDACDDRYALARLTVTSTMTGDDLARLLSSSPTRAARRERPRTKAWRCYRRIRHEAGRGAKQ